MDPKNRINVSKMINHYRDTIERGMPMGEMWDDPWPTIPSDPEPGFGDGDYN